MPTTTITPVDVSAIKGTITPWIDACLTRNWDKLLALCTDDVVFLPPDEPVVAAGQVRPWLENYPEIKAFDVEFDHVEGQDQIAVARGRFTITVMPEGAPAPMTVNGKFTDTFRKDDQGKWRYASVTWNSSLPTPLKGLAAKAAGAPLQAVGLAPGLTVDDLTKSIKLFEGLGFVVTDRWEQDGKLTGVMLGGGNAMLGLSQDDGAKGWNRTKGVGTRYWIETSQSIDDIAARATAAGVTLEKGPYDTPWHSRALDVRTPEGFAFTISSPMT